MSACSAQLVLGGRPAPGGAAPSRQDEGLNSFIKAPGPSHQVSGPQLLSSGGTGSMRRQPNGEVTRKGSASSPAHLSTN